MPLRDCVPELLVHVCARMPCSMPTLYRFVVCVHVRGCCFYLLPSLALLPMHIARPEAKVLYTTHKTKNQWARYTSFSSTIFPPNSGDPKKMPARGCVISLSFSRMPLSRFLFFQVSDCCRAALRVIFSFFYLVQRCGQRMTVTIPVVVLDECLLS